MYTKRVVGLKDLSRISTSGYKQDIVTSGMALSKLSDIVHLFISKRKENKGNEEDFSGRIYSVYGVVVLESRLLYLHMTHQTKRGR